MTYGRSLRRLASLAVLALLVPAACGGTANKEGGAGGAPTPSGGDGTSCAQAVDITAVVAGGGTYSGKATAEGAFQGRCASQKGRIEFLHFDAAPGNYKISVLGPHDDAAATAVLDVRTDCASSASELTCIPHAPSTNIFVGVSKPGGVFLVLSGDWYGGGYRIRIEPSPKKCASDIDCGGGYPQIQCATKTGICYAPLDCAPGTADCDADPDDGCEADITKDTANCGVCGLSCLGPNVKNGTCAASACTIACEPGYADCDTNPANGCETYLQGDGANCGACGNDCMHGGCAASTCTAPPVAIGTTTAMTPNGPIALDAASVYVAGQVSPNMGGVMSIPKSGGAATLVVHDDCNIGSLVVDAGTVYWAGADCTTFTGAIKSAPVAGGATKVLTSESVYNPAGLIADATTLYWYETSFGAVLSLPKAGGQPKGVARLVDNGVEMQVSGLAADATNLYFTARDYLTSTTALYSVPKSGGAHEVLATLPPGSSGKLAISGTDLYVATDTNIAHTPTMGVPPTPFAGANLGSPDPTTTLAVTSLAIAGGNLYWSAGATKGIAVCPIPGGMWKIPLAGGAAVGLASDESPGPIAADASGVYMSATCSGGIALRAGP